MIYTRLFLPILAALHPLHHGVIVVSASLAASGGSCPASNSDDFVSCPSTPPSTASPATAEACPICTCTAGRKLIKREADSVVGPVGLRGAAGTNEEMSVVPYEDGDGSGRELQNKWGWDDCWIHYWCGGQEDVDLADTGLEPDVRDRWENGGGAGGDGIVDDITELICEDGVLSGRCSGGAEEDGKCKDPGLSRPPVSSPTYWIGGFGLDWEAKKTGHCATCCVDIYTVTLTFDDAFDCNPGKYGLLVICGIAGPYDVKYEWEITVECPVPGPPTKKPTPPPTTKLPTTPPPTTKLPTSTEPPHSTKLPTSTEPPHSPGPSSGITSYSTHASSPVGTVEKYPYGYEPFHKKK